MEESKLKELVVDLLFSLDNANRLDFYIVNCITESLKIDAFELCESNGISYMESL